MDLELTAERLGRIRSEGHIKARNNRPGLKCEGDGLREDIVGAAGELAFARCTGYAVEARILAGGDNGIDFHTALGTVDVKTFMKPYNLLVLPKDIEHIADFIFLGQYFTDTKAATLIGYATRDEIVGASQKDFGYGASYFIPAARLHPVKEFITRLREAETKLAHAHEHGFEYVRKLRAAGRNKSYKER